MTPEHKITLIYVALFLLVGVVICTMAYLVIRSVRFQNLANKRIDSLMSELIRNVNGHTDDKIEELDNSLKDKWSESVSSIIPIVSSGVNENLTNVKELIVSLLKEQSNIRMDIKLINEQVPQLERYIKKTREVVLVESSYIREISDKNAKIVMNHFDQLSTYKTESVKEPKQVFLDPFYIKSCKYCDKPLNITKSKGNNRKFCEKSEGGIKNYCRDMYYKRLNKSTNV